MKKSLLRKRLLILSVLLLMVCGQMLAGRSGSVGDNGMYNGIRYTRYSNYSYYYYDVYDSYNLGDVAVITSFSGTQMIIPESLGGCSKIVIGSGALTSSVRDLQISKSVKLLEFNAVYNATNIESLTIADGTTLICLGAGQEEKTSQNGSFSYLKKLQSVYLGGNLEYDENSEYYNAPFYNLNTEQAFSLTIGPNVTSIPERCFGNCDDIKSIKAMPQTPPSLDYNAFGNTSKTVSVKVSYKTKNAYTSASDWKYFTNYVLDTDLCKTDALNDLNAEAGQNPSATVQGVVSDYKNKINAATSGADVVTNLNAGKAAIQLQKAKDSAIAALNTEAGDSPSEAVARERDTWIANVNKATTIDDVKNAKEEGIQALKDAKDLQDAKDDAIAELTEAKVVNPSGAADDIFNTYKEAINAAGSIDEVTAAKEEGIKALKDAKDLQDLQDAKDDAIAELTEAKVVNPSGAADNIFNTYKEAINAAGSIDEVTAAKEEGIKALKDAKDLQDLQDAKEDAIAELTEAKEKNPSGAADNIFNTYKEAINAAESIDEVTAAKEEGIKALQEYVEELKAEKASAKAELEAAKSQYPSENADEIVNNHKTEIEDATTIDDVKNAKEEGIKALKDAKDLQDLQDAKDDAIAELTEAKVVNPSGAADDIFNTYKEAINAAGSIDEVTAAKEEGIKALKDAKDLQDLQDAKDDAIAELTEAKVVNPSGAADNIFNTYKEAINAAGSIDEVTAAKEEGIKALKDAKDLQDLQDAKEDAIAELTEAKEKNPSGAADNIFNTYKEAINAAESIDEVTAAKEEGIKALQEYVEELKAEKASAKAELEAAKSQYPSEYADNIVNNCKTEIEDATTIEDVKNAKEEGIDKLIEAYNDLQELKSKAVTELDKAEEEYPSANASSIVEEGKSAINDAKSQSEVGEKKEYYISQLKTAFEEELYNAKEDAINALNQAKDEYPSDEFEDIVSTYTDRINAATSTDAVTAIKEEGIQALAYAAEMPTVLHINFAEGSVPIEKEHYMTDSKFTLDEDCNVVLTINGNSVTYPWDMAGKITLFKGAPAVEFSASKDPESVSDYYTTFYSSLEAYTIPEGVKAYTATLDEKETGVIHLNEIKDDIIPAETAVVLISESGSYSAYTSDYAISETEEERGILKGTDVEIPVPDENCYILSGTSKLGIGLYPWSGEGKKLSANKAYLQLTSASPAKAFTFVFDEKTTSIERLTPTLSEGEGVYNLQGIRVNDSYKGIIIKNGKKTLNK